MKRTQLFKTAFAGLAMVATAAALAASPAMAACEGPALSLINNLDGSWRGSGTIQPVGGAKERLSCRVSYKASGPRIKQEISCAGTDYKFDAGADVSCDGTSVSGTWNERVANNTGRVKGNIKGDRLNLDVKGPNFEGRFNIKVADRSKHSLTITQFDPGRGRHVPIAEIALRR